jgi:hypothetical protein
MDTTQWIEAESQSYEEETQSIELEEWQTILPQLPGNMEEEQIVSKKQKKGKEPETPNKKKKTDDRNKANGGQGRKTSPARIRWVFRCNAEGDETEGQTLSDILSKFCQCFCFQKESAPDTGYLHFQGYLELINKNRHTWIQKQIDPFHFHYLMQAKGTPKQAWSYGCKEETRVQGPWIMGMYDTTPPKATANQVFAEALAASSVFEGLAIIKEQKPRDFCLYASTIERHLNMHHAPPFKSKYQLADFNHPPLSFPKTTHVFGPSETGKTSFVIAHFKNPLVVSHIDTLKKLSPDHDAIIFDDMVFTAWEPEAVIHLVDIDLDRDIHIRYSTVHIPANTVKVFTHNTRNIFFKETCPEEQKAAINRRLQYIGVGGKLFG